MSPKKVSVLPYFFLRLAKEFALSDLLKDLPIPFQRLFFYTEEGLYTRNVCVNRPFWPFWHFAIIFSLIIIIIFYP